MIQAIAAAVAITLQSTQASQAASQAELVNAVIASTRANGPIPQARFIDVISDPANPANPAREAAINADKRVYLQNGHNLNTNCWSIMSDAEIAALARLRPGRGFLNGIVDVTEQPKGDGRVEIEISYSAGDSSVRTALKGEAKNFLTLVTRCADEAEERERARLEAEAAKVRAFMKDGQV